MAHHHNELPEHGGNFFSDIISFSKYFLGSFLLSKTISGVADYAFHNILHIISALTVAFILYWANNFWFPIWTAKLSEKYPRIFPPKPEKK
jgi:hypothetical protein